MKNKRVLKVPDKSGEFFCSYDPANIPSLFKSNQELFNSYKIKIGGKSYRDFCKDLESDILNLIPGKNSGPLSRPFISSGHQPVLYHPGILAKNVFIDKVAEENRGTAFDFIIDFDCPSEIGCYTIAQKEKIERKKEVLLRLESQQPLECCAPPSYNQFKEFCEKNQDYFQAFSESPITKNIENFFQNGKNALPVSKNLADFLLTTRKGFEKGSLRYLGIMLSSLCKTSSFLLFALHIAEDIKIFFDIYNRQLEKYRINHKLRYKANPFPNLKKDLDKFEIPFWCIKENRRKPVYVVHEGPYILFYSENSILFKYKEGDFGHAFRIIEEKKINLRPKAVSLTLFLRMFFTDIFIHGISGAKYDEVTDGIIEKYFKVKPPGYIAVSLTLFPDLPLNKVPKNEIDNLKTIIRDIKYNPEIFETQIDDYELKKKFRKLIEKKQKLLKQGELFKDKKEHYRQLKSITEELSAFLHMYDLKIKNQLRFLEEKEKEDQVVCFREYPYFLYDVNMVKKMIL